MVEEVHAVLPHHALHGVGLREHHFDVCAVFLAGGIDDVVGLLREPAGIEREDARLRVDLHEHVDEHHVLGAEARGQRGPLPERVERQPEHILRPHGVGPEREGCDRFAIHDVHANP